MSANWDLPETVESQRQATHGALPNGEKFPTPKVWSLFEPLWWGKIYMVTIYKEIREMYSTICQYVLTWTGFLIHKGRNLLCRIRLVAGISWRMGSRWSSFPRRFPSLWLSMRRCRHATIFQKQIAVVNSRRDAISENQQTEIAPAWLHPSIKAKADSSRYGMFWSWQWLSCTCLDPVANLPSPVQAKTSLAGDAVSYAAGFGQPMWLQILST